MDPTDEMAVKVVPAERPAGGAVAGSIDKLDEQLRVSVEALLHPSPPRPPVDELGDLLSAIDHHLDGEASERKKIYNRLLAIQSEMERPASRGFARYLIAFCIGVAVILAWLSYGEATKQIIATGAPELGWSPEAKQMIASWVQRLGWTKPPAGPESTAVRPSLPATQVATAAQTVPGAVVPKALAAPSNDPEQVHQIAVDLAALGQTVDQLAASQDQMVHQIDMLQNSNQEILASNREILEKIPAPPPPPPTVAPTHKPTASIRRPYP